MKPKRGGMFLGSMTKPDTDKDASTTEPPKTSDCRTFRKRTDANNPMLCPISAFNTQNVQKRRNERGSGLILAEKYKIMDEARG